jgi:Zn-dependent peptidase ImmA (M78 family)
MEAMEQPLASDVPEVSSQASAESVAREQRAAFGITVRQQLGWKTSSEAFRQWREALEARRILVFQGDFPREEAQGFSLSDSEPYSIVVTQKKEEPFTARCFTLFHEYAHLLLREGGVCLTAEAPPSDGSNVAKTEYWCQRFAEAFLVDADALRDRPETEAVLRRGPGYEQALQRLAFAFKVSQHVLLFRLWHLDLMPQRRFWQEYNRVREEAAEAVRRREKRKEGGGGPPPAQRAVQERGRLFTRIVLDALEREMLSDAEVIEYLGVRPKHLETVRRAVYG